MPLIQINDVDLTQYLIIFKDRSSRLQQVLNCNTYNLMMKVDQIEQDIQISENCEEKSLTSNARNGFIRKVYGLLSIQMVITVLFVLPTLLSPSYAAFQSANMWLFYLAVVGSVAFILPLACMKDLSKKVPVNYLLLFGFTISESYLVSIICSFYTPESVFQAAVTTCAATIGLTAYAMNTRSDFTECKQWMMGKLCLTQDFSGVSSSLLWQLP